MQTSGPRRYSKLELCSTQQLERLAQEFCYDTETLRGISAELTARSSLQATYVRRGVDRQIAALTATPPKTRAAFRVSLRQAAVVVVGTLVMAAAVDGISQRFAATPAVHQAALEQH